MSEKVAGQPSSDSNVQYVQQAPPPYTMNPPNPGQPQVIQTIVVRAPAGPDPMIMTCPSCAHQIVTRTEKSANGRTHLIACILFLFICWPCTCLPYCMNSCNNVDHYCPNCNAYIGGYKF